MKKVFTWFSSLAVILTFIFSFSVTSFAAEPQQQQIPDQNGQQSIALDKKLEKMGIPDDLINGMPFDQKKHIVSGELKFQNSTVSEYDSNGKIIKKTTYDNKDHKSVENYNSCEPGQMCPFTISTTTMSLTMYTFYEATNNGHQRREIDISYEWLKDPSAKGYDPIGISWDDKWRYVDGTLYHKDMYHSTISGNLYVNYEDSAASYINEGGIGWDAELKDSITATDYNGWGYATIERTDTSSSFTGRAYGKYCHTWGSGSISLAIDFLTVNFNGSKTHDDRATSTTFN